MTRTVYATSNPRRRPEICHSSNPSHHRTAPSRQLCRGNSARCAKWKGQKAVFPLTKKKTRNHQRCSSRGIRVKHRVGFAVKRVSERGHHSVGSGSGSFGKPRATNALQCGFGRAFVWWRRRAASRSAMVLITFAEGMNLRDIFSRWQCKRTTLDGAASARWPSAKECFFGNPTFLAFLVQERIRKWRIMLVRGRKSDRTVVLLYVPLSCCSLSGFAASSRFRCTLYFRFVKS